MDKSRTRRKGRILRVVHDGESDLGTRSGGGGGSRGDSQPALNNANIIAFLEELSHNMNDLRIQAANSLKVIATKMGQLEARISILERKSNEQRTRNDSFEAQGLPRADGS